MAGHGACNLTVVHIYEGWFFFQSDSEKIENIGACNLDVVQSDNFIQNRELLLILKIHIEVLLIHIVSLTDHHKIIHRVNGGINTHCFKLVSL